MNLKKMKGTSAIKFDPFILSKRKTKSKELRPLSSLIIGIKDNAANVKHIPPPHTHSTLEAIKCDVSKRDVLKFPGDRRTSTYN